LLVQRERCSGRREAREQAPEVDELYPWRVAAVSWSRAPYG
jgi:hypothetical protein